MVAPRWFPRSLASVALTVLFLPMTTATPEVRDASEATVFVDGSADSFTFAPGASISTGATWIITAPDGRQASVTKTGAANGGGVQSWRLSGTQVTGVQGDWTWVGDLDGAAADGTWTVQVRDGVYQSAGTEGEAYGYRVGLAVAGRTLEFAYVWLSVATSVQAWNWHEGSWNEPHHELATADSPTESRAEDPQHARFFASTTGPQDQSIPGAGDSETIPAQDINTPPATIPATCTLGPCTSETPLTTPAQPIAETCVPPLVPLLCVGPFTVPAQDLGDAPAVCDAAEQVCVGPFPVPAQDVVETEAITVAFDFTGLDVLADPHAAELTSIGPFVQVIPVPIIGDVPVTVCPDTCPFPVSPEGETVGSLTITVTVGDEDESVTIPLGQSV